MFYEDARIGSEVLGLTLTSRAHGKTADVPLAGFPYHSIDQYLSRMLKAGYRVAVCEQIEDPKLAKGIVKREVLDVITPGTATTEGVIDAASNNYLISLTEYNHLLGIAGVDVSTGEFFIIEGEPKLVLTHLESLNPKEILVSVEQAEKIKQLIRWSPQPLFTPVEDYFFDYEYAYHTLLNHFNTVSLKGFGCEEMPAGISSAGAALKYLHTIQDGRLGHIQKLSIMNLTDYMVLDKATRRNLEILTSVNDARKGSLLDVLDRTVTKMGTRLLKTWLMRPLLNKAAIYQRLQTVEELLKDIRKRDSLRLVLCKLSDIERITSKINANRANARDVRGLCQSLTAIPGIVDILKESISPLLNEYSNQLNPLSDITTEINNALAENLPVMITEGGFIRDGYDTALDELRIITRSGKKWIIELQEQERQRTGISSLKIHYNKVFGYYIEVTKPNLSRVPLDYIRKQTVVNAERFITPEIKRREEQILTAEEQIIKREQELFQLLRQKVSEKTAELQRNAQIIAHLDVFCGFALIAQENNYCKPEITEGRELIFEDCRHPVVEQMLPSGEPFIPNDHSLLTENDQIHIITGPNMAGKSTFLRQVGLCILMAQIGSFVPAKRAEIGIVDRIFTRVGAHDDVSRGESTFLIEMIELANILNNATPRSLLLLDEIGRGTSTFDGLSIAWATVEYLHNMPSIAAKTLFATHFHELTAIAQHLPKVKNYYVHVKEWEDKVIFLRKILPGASDHSYGIHVAQMAGIPPTITTRARTVLSNLEALELTPGTIAGSVLSQSNSREGFGEYQINLFSIEDTQIRQILQSINPETISPREAIQILFDLKRMLFKK
jgi:DNA mismatch repair protein MutS